MGKIKQNIREAKKFNFKINRILEISLKSFLRNSYHQPRVSRKKPYGIQADDWHQLFGCIWPLGLYNSVISEYKWRNFRFYKSKEARRRALIDLKKAHPHIKFRIHQYDYHYIKMFRPEEIQPTIFQRIKKFLKYG